MKFHWMHRFDFGNTEDKLVEMARTLEKSKAYSVLLTYSIWSPDYVPFLPTMIRLTKNLKFMMAFRPYTLSPEYAIRFFNTMKQTYGDRLTFNMVAGKMLEDEEQAAIKMYNLEESLINTIEKRIEFTDKWAEKFFSYMKPEDLISYTIANSPMTLKLGNRWTDYIIFDHWKMEENYAKAKDTKLVLCIDPLIRETKEELDSEIEYYYQSWETNKSLTPSILEKREHLIRGNMEEVKQQISEISKKYGVNDFMITTSQKDISSLLKLMEEMSD
jgi:hypothetical protein